VHGLDDVLLKISQGTKTLIGEESVVGDAELQLHAGTVWVIVTWRQRIA